MIGVMKGRELPVSIPNNAVTLARLTSSINLGRKSPYERDSPSFVGTRDGGNRSRVAKKSIL
jgi:hypothetical protein